MEKGKIVLAVVVLLVANLVVAGPSLAAATKTDFDVFEVTCWLDPGTSWTTGEDEKVLHIRGYLALSVFYDADTLAMAGVNAIVGNANLNQPTGNGGYFGTFSGVYWPASATGTFDGHWSGHMSSGVFSGRAGGHGTGDLEGHKIMVKLRSLSEAEVADLLPQLPSPPCPGGVILGLFRDTGFILSPHGE